MSKLARLNIVLPRSVTRWTVLARFRVGGKRWVYAVLAVQFQCKSSIIFFLFLFLYGLLSSRVRLSEYQYSVPRHGAVRFGLEVSILKTYSLKFCILRAPVCFFTKV